MEIGTLLRKLRDSKGLTTRQIAERIGVSHSTYMDWEHDKSSPSFKWYLKLAAAFQLCPVEFMAYLTGHVEEPISSEERISMAKMKEMVSYYQDYSNLLLQDKEKVELELVRVQKLLKEKGLQ